MRPTRSDTTSSGQRRAWEAPTVTTIAINTATKSPAENGQTAVQPSPPAPPASKLGFSIEMGFPLSARTEG
jgi:hypothetical protein